MNKMYLFDGEKILFASKIDLVAKTFSPYKSKMKFDDFQMMTFSVADVETE